MARWKLKEKHYLNVGGVEWEQIETLQETGEQIRHRFPVPLYLDPEDGGILKRWGQGGELIVSDGNDPEGRLNPKDIVFSGPPTPAMEPIDESAEAITAAARPAWIHPVESLPGQGFNENLLQALSKQLADAFANSKAVAPIIGVDPADFKILQEQVAALLARNAELESQTTAVRRL